MKYKLSFLCLACFIVAYGLPLEDCSQGYSDNMGCKHWKNVGLCANVIYESFVKKYCKATCGYCKAFELAPSSRLSSDAQIEPVNMQECLGAHNEKRALHVNDSALSWNSELQDRANKWALKLAEENKGLHPDKGNFGENLYFGGSFGSYRSCKEAVQSWYSGIKYYNWSNPGFSMKTGEFTQVVWKSSIQLGVGRAVVERNRMNMTYIVANYSPPGNMIGQFNSNVPPLKKDMSSF